MIYMAVCMFSLIHNNAVLNNKMYDKSQTNCFLQPVKTITPGGAWVLCSGRLVERQSARCVRDLWVCFARAGRAVRQIKAVHVGTQSAVSSPQLEEDGLLMALEVCMCHLTVRRQAVFCGPGCSVVSFHQILGHGFTA